MSGVRFLNAVFSAVFSFDSCLAWGACEDFHRFLVGFRMFRFLLKDFAALLRSLQSEAWEACQASQVWFSLIIKSFCLILGGFGSFERFRCPTKKKLRV